MNDSDIIYSDHDGSQENRTASSKPLEEPLLQSPGMSSVDDMQMEIKNQRTKKVGCIVMIAIMIAIICGLAAFGTDEAVNNNRSKPRSTENIVKPEMVLPNTTLDIEIVTISKSKGEITYHQLDYFPQKLTFDFLSYFNKTDDLVRFVCQLTSVSSIDINYYTVLNGICGFEIDLINNITNESDSKETPRNVNKSTKGTSYLKIDIYNINGTQDSFIIDQHSENTESSESKLNSLVGSKIGEYFVELSIKLGSLQYKGNDSPSIHYITNYARYFWSICRQNETFCPNWDKDILNEAVSLTNEIINDNTNNAIHHQNKSYHRSNTTKNIISSLNYTTTATTMFASYNTTKKNTKPVKNLKNKKNIKEKEQQRRLQSSSSDTCTVTWYWLGDGYCDESANNAQCNYDNGDCCESSCDDSLTWEDFDGNDYSGYSCGSNGYNCLPDCNVDHKHYLGDGYCDKTGGYNSLECNYDNGDCCETTCKDNDYTCGYNGYECLSDDNLYYIDESDDDPNWCVREGGYIDDHYCDNDCLGLCGTGCNCWLWACGDCHCHRDCSEHDTYCSCVSIWSFWCLNVFWIDCDNGQNVIFG